MTTSIPIQEQTQIRNKTAKPLLWVAMAGMTMIFASLTSAYVVRQADPDWLEFDLPTPFFISTAIIILSSFTLVFADYSAKKDNQTGIKLGLGLTLFLSIVFVYSQFYAYGVMIQHGMFFSGTNISSSFLLFKCFFT